MKPSSRAIWLLSLSTVGMLSSPPAAADSPSTEASGDARREQAKQRFQTGSAHYAAGRYRQAVSEFIEADRLAPSPALSFNIARAYERLSDTSGALRWYRDYLRRSGSAKNADEVRARIAELSAELGKRGEQQLTVLSMPPGAKVVVDGRELGVTPITSDLRLGEHRVLLTLSGYRDSSQEIALSSTEARDLSVSLAPLPVSRTAAASKTELRRASSLGAWPYVVAGAGAASLGGALAFELKRRDDEDAARTADNQIAFSAHAERMQRDQTAARVLLGVGSALVVGGAVMFVLDHRKSETAQVQVGCAFGGCGALARGRF